MVLTQAYQTYKLIKKWRYQKKIKIRTFLCKSIKTDNMKYPFWWYVYSSQLINIQIHINIYRAFFFTVYNVSFMSSLTER